MEVESIYKKTKLLTNFILLFKNQIVLSYFFFFAAYGIERSVKRFPVKPIRPLIRHQILVTVPRVELGKQFSISPPFDHVSRHFSLMELVVFCSQSIFEGNCSFLYECPVIYDFLIYW